MSINSEDFMQQWADAQKRYWDAWAELAKMGSPYQSPTTTDTNKEPQWAQGLDQWWKAVSHYTEPGPVADVFQRVVNMGKTYMSMAETTYKVQNSELQSMDAVNAWIDALEKSFHTWVGQLEAGKITVHDFGLGQAAIDSWERVLKSMGMQMAQTLGGGFQMPMLENWQEQLNKFLEMPTVGNQQETKERWDKLLRLAKDYQSCVDNYLKAYAKQGLEAVGVLRKRIQTLQAQGKGIETLRQLYDLWVEVNEEVYAQFALTDEYQVIYGDMINGLITLKKALNDELADYYRSGNIPTRTDLNMAFKRQHELKRENRQLKRQVQELARKVDSLLLASQTGQGAAKPPSSV